MPKSGSASSRSGPPLLSLLTRGRGSRVPHLARAQLSHRVARAMLAAGLSSLPQGEPLLALSLADDGELLALNRQFADEDHATDVLSFSQREGMALPVSAPVPLGDVIISVETARRQARAGKRTLDEELFHLAVHGLVHLLGYDHATPAEEKVMFGYEAKLRASALAPGAVVRVRRPRVVAP